MEEEGANPKRRVSLLRRRSSMTSSKVPFEDQLSLISSDLPPEELLRKLFHLCARATGHTLKNKIEEDLFSKLLSYEHSGTIAPELTPSLRECQKNIAGVRAYSAHLEAEVAEWDKELEARRKNHFIAKQEFKAGGREEEADKTPHCKSKYLEVTSESIASLRAELSKHSSHFARHRFFLEKHQLQTEKKMDLADNALKEVTQIIRDKTLRHYNSKEDEIKVMGEVLKSSLEKIESWL